MGKRSRAAAMRRSMLSQHTRAIIALDTETRADPRYLEAVAAGQDDQVRALTAEFLPAQRDRLHHAGFRLNTAATDGSGTWDHPRRRVRIIHSVAREGDGQVWAHVSVSHEGNTLPGWYEVRDAQWLFYPDEAGIIVVAPRGEHVNIAEVAHVWTCLTGAAVPDFRHLGMI